MSVPFSVVFMYPEFAETDFIEEFVEDQAFEDHLVGYFFNIVQSWNNPLVQIKILTNFYFPGTFAWMELILIWLHGTRRLLRRSSNSKYLHTRTNLCNAKFYVIRKI